MNETDSDQTHTTVPEREMNIGLVQSFHEPGVVSLTSPGQGKRKVRLVLGSTTLFFSRESATNVGEALLHAATELRIAIANDDTDAAVSE